jgi:hypothetical protein
VLVGEVSPAISAAVKTTTCVNVPVLPHVVSRGVVLAAHRADVALLAVLERP